MLCESPHMAHGCAVAQTLRYRPWLWVACSVQKGWDCTLFLKPQPAGLFLVCVCVLCGQAELLVTGFVAVAPFGLLDLFPGCLRGTVDSVCSEVAGDLSIVIRLQSCL